MARGTSNIIVPMGRWSSIVEMLNRAFVDVWSDPAIKSGLAPHGTTLARSMGETGGVNSQRPNFRSSAT